MISKNKTKKNQLIHVFKKGPLVLLMGCIPCVYGMDLLQVYQAAKKQDATLQAARYGAIAESERLPQARSQMLPTISLSLSENNNQLESTSPDFLGREQSTQRSYTSANQTLLLRQPLFKVQLLAQYRQAVAQIKDAEALLDNEEQNLTVRVCGAYFEAMLSHDQLALVLAQQIAFRSQLDAAQKAYKLGSGTRTDIDEAQSRLDMNLAQEIESRQNVLFTMQQLQTLTNDPILKLSTLNASGFKMEPLESNDLDSWIQKAEQNSPQLKSLWARISTSEEEVNKAQSGHYPTLELIAQLQKSTSENVTNTSSKYTNNSVGLQLNIPIYAGGYYSATVRQASANLERAQQNYESGKRSVALQTHKEFRGITENMAKVRALEQAMRSSEQLVTSSQKSYQGGSRTVLDVLNAEQQKASVQRDLAQARYMYLISKVRLLSLVGEADERTIKDINLLLENQISK